MQQARGRHRRLCAVTLLGGLRAQAGHRRRATDPESNIRTWLDATLFADGELKIGFVKADGAGREVLAAGKLYASAKYNAI